MMRETNLTADAMTEMYKVSGQSNRIADSMVHRDVCSQNRFTHDGREEDGCFSPVGTIPQCLKIFLIVVTGEGFR